jgi:glycosyltransferase involved in cell wall biosynthesis
LILFLGRLIPRKGADFLIEALPLLGNCNAIKLLIAGPEGETGYLALLKHKARALGVEKQVLFVGPLYDDSKRAALVDANIFALPSRYENFGNSAAEAIACGTPVVVSDRCGIAALVNGRAGLVSEYSAGSLAQKLNQLLNDEPLYERLQAGCAELAQKLSWDGLVDTMLGCYAEARKDVLRRASV